MASRASTLEIVKGNYDLLVAGFIIGIVLMIIIPLPTFMLDILLVFSMTSAMIIFLITLFTEEPLQFSVFPSLLLITTLYRLALNISSTRAVLSQAYAGKVISAFGDFVVGGNYVVGLVVFIIIMVVQFVVITNGSSRVAEVAARFTLDAMPGKQMAIDADFNAGLITEDQARERRAKLQKEADFFGSMDGATKFIKGDAIAGVIITFINIIGGLIIGQTSMGMSLTEAAQTYTILTIGDGLVSQIPALLISTGTGIMVTRSKSGQSFGRDFSGQILTFPKVIALASGILFILSLVPALPRFLFLSMAAGTFFLFWVLRQEEQKDQKRMEREKIQTSQEEQRQPENVQKLFKVDPLEIEIGYKLVALTDTSQGGDLLQRLATVRRQCASELGIYVRPIRIRDNLQLDPSKYVFKIKGVGLAQGEIMPNYYLAMDAENTGRRMEGIPTKEPTFGLPALWIKSEQKIPAEIQGFTVVDAATVMITHLTEFIKAHAYELLGRQDVKELLDMVKENDPAVVEELIPDTLSLGEIQRVLQNLLRERIPIRDLVTILEALSDGVRNSRDADYLTQYVRIALGRTICQLFANQDGKISVITLEPKLEQLIADSIQMVQEGGYPVLEPGKAQNIIGQLTTIWDQLSFQGMQPVLLCSAKVRLPFRRLVEKYLPQLNIMSISELVSDTEIESVGVVKMG
ncbi:flagellar biosynthesis protein FlhA [Candidatus Formimonas warabiya]|uniref:Flagellar biosynthesis protein FlhA n=1 Tax=Formimonas warabiya TaxID=1761012 RepID=A0A3G1KT62_FORW1|nr:flagellar biosynthesis protein FlhA [Candidatus Formimonas warabiya]ATW25651.1 flagellar biosynthesis protein FlhA [Candidatus Formimonas warabiya]